MDTKSYSFFNAIFLVVLGCILCSSRIKVVCKRNYFSTFKNETFEVCFIITLFTFPQVHLVHSVLALSTRVLGHSTVGRTTVSAHQKPRVHGFLQACSAYCYVTVPSIACLKQRLKLYLVTAQVSLMTRCFGQALAAIQGESHHQYHSCL